MIIFSFIFPLLIGWFVIDYFLRNAPLLFKLCAAIGIGIGISSIFSFLWIILVGQFTVFLIVAETVLSIVLILMVYYTKTILLFARIREWFLYRMHRIYRREKFFISNATLTKNSYFPFIGIILFASAIFAALAFKQPHGEWDAWAIWNLRARFLFLGGEHWKDAFSSILSWSHLDYPLLLPLTIARQWFYSNSLTLLAPNITAWLFMFLALGMLYSLLSTMRDKQQALFGTILLASTPFFLKHSAEQYADVPLSFFILLFCSLLIFYHTTLDRKILSLAGIVSGLALWTKNEGILFVALFLFIHTIFSLKTNGIKSTMRELLYFSFGLFPIALIVFYFKIYIVPENAFSSQLPLALSHLFEWERYIYVGKKFAQLFNTFGGFIISLFFCLYTYNTRCRMAF
ncbi:MAG: glycosyltransferase family 39 protein [Parcubacteria group bacterium]|nr:glycosyltransferase family 39 protein [Parcubacteria group bacterium]